MHNPLVGWFTVSLVPGHSWTARSVLTFGSQVTYGAGFSPGVLRAREVFSWWDSKHKYIDIHIYFLIGMLPSEGLANPKTSPNSQSCSVNHVPTIFMNFSFSSIWSMWLELEKVTHFTMGMFQNNGATAWSDQSNWPLRSSVGILILWAISSDDQSFKLPVTFRGVLPNLCAW